MRARNWIGGAGAVALSLGRWPTGSAPTVRGNDAIGRFGGDELAVLLVNATTEQATLVAERWSTQLSSDANQDRRRHRDHGRRSARRCQGGRPRPSAAARRRFSRALRRAAHRAAGVRPRVVPESARRRERQRARHRRARGRHHVGGIYQVLHELSRGAMGVVYRAEDLGLGRPVAIKVLRSDLAQRRELVARFRAEAAMLASLHHQNLVQVYALGEHAGDVYFVMELVEGQPLARCCARRTSAASGCRPTRSRRSRSRSPTRSTRCTRSA